MLIFLQIAKLFMCTCPYIMGKSISNKQQKILLINFSSLPFAEILATIYTKVLLLALTNVSSFDTKFDTLIDL